MPYKDKDKKKENDRRYRKENFDKLNDQRIRYREENKDTLNEKSKEYYRKTDRDAYLKRTYNGFSAKDYDRMLEEQDGACYICGQHETKLDYRSGEPLVLSVDHNKKTGRVRRLLCNACNRALGFFKHSPELLEIAAAYIRRHAGTDNGGEEHF